MKSCKFLKNCKRIDKEREKTLMQQSMRKEKQKSWNLLFDIRMAQEISKGEVGNGK